MTQYNILMAGQCFAFASAAPLIYQKIAHLHFGWDFISILGMVLCTVGDAVVFWLDKKNRLFYIVLIAVLVFFNFIPLDSAP